VLKRLCFLQLLYSNATGYSVKQLEAWDANLKLIVELGQLGCPNFVQVLPSPLVALPYPPLKCPFWDNLDPHNEGNKFLYTHMELASEGSVGHFVDEICCGKFLPTLIRPVFFQMAVSLVVFTSKYGMAHYDVKSDNFLLDRRAVRGYLVLLYEIDDMEFAVRMPYEQPFIAQLIDFDNADNIPEPPEPMKKRHIGTYEFLAIEAYIQGNEAQQGSQMDMFGLGLSFYHLTGAAYNYTMKNVLCPKILKERLQAIWESSAKYSTMKWSLSCVQKHQDDPDVLFNTVYRYLVLLDMPPHGHPMETTAVWQAIAATILNGGPESIEFEEHRAQFNLRNGHHTSTAHTRYHLGESGIDLLCQLCALDPSQRPRPTVPSVLDHKYFRELLDSGGVEESKNEEPDTTIKFSFP
jgi:serine/threonine protein kinase